MLGQRVGIWVGVRVRVGVRVGIGVRVGVGLEQTAYDVRMRYGEDATSIFLWWQVSDAATGEAVWTDQDRRLTGWCY